MYNAEINSVWGFIAFLLSFLYGIFQFNTMKETKKISTSNHQHQKSLERILQKLQQEMEEVSLTTNAAYFLALSAHKRLDKFHKEQETSKLLSTIERLRNDDIFLKEYNSSADKINFSKKRGKQGKCIIKY